jgi:hypothetical protein
LNWLNCLRLRVELLKRLPRWLWLLKLLHCDWTWLRIHELWLPKAWAKLIWHWGGNTHHGFLLLNSGNVHLGFWAPFDAITSSVIIAVGYGLWASRVLFPFPFPWVQIFLLCLDYCSDWTGNFHIIDISWILELRSPCHFSVALSCFISFNDSSAVIFVRHGVFFKFMKKFINYFGFLSCQMRSCWSRSRPLISAWIVVL